MSYDIVVVPTYRRYETLVRDTLPMLLAGGIEPDRIHVWVGGADEDASELAAYRSALRGLPEVKLYRAPVGTAAANNAIIRTYESGARIVHCDDDLRGIRTLGGSGRLEDVGDLHGLLSQAFEFTARQRVSLWGLSPAANGMFMRQRWRTGLAFAIGQCFGVINDPALRLELTVKEDYERTLLHYERDGAVARLDNLVAISRPMRGHPGGMQAYHPDRRAREREAAAALLRRWPGLVHVKRERDGYAEIALRLPARAAS